jgi:FkbM family methyltransferase
MSYKLNIYNN